MMAFTPSLNGVQPQHHGVVFREVPPILRGRRVLPKLRPSASVSSAFGRAYNGSGFLERVERHITGSTLPKEGLDSLLGDIVEDALIGTMCHGFDERPVGESFRLSDVPAGILEVAITERLPRANAEQALTIVGGLIADLKVALQSGDALAIDEGAVILVDGELVFVRLDTQPHAGLYAGFAATSHQRP